MSLDLEGGRVEVVSTADPSVFADVLAALGTKGTFRHAHGRFERLGTRINDAQPYWGGGRVKTNSSFCSSGFSVLRPSGTAYMLTAGHCWAVGTNVTDGNGDAYGSVQIRAAFPNRDIEAIGGKTYGGYIWMGACVGCAWAPVIGAGDPVVGNDYCSSGSVTYEVCGLHTTAVNLFACDPDGLCTFDLVRFSNDTPWQEGDSGGPIFYKFTGPTRVSARATIIGQWLGNSYGQEWSAIAQVLGMSICTESNGPC